MKLIPSPADLLQSGASRRTRLLGPGLALSLLAVVLSAPVAFSAVKSSLADIGPAPPVALIDSEGKPFELARLRGKVVLVSFIFTTCGGTCPATTHNLTRVEQALEEEKLWGRKVEFLSITLDPARDTPEVLGRYARIYDVDLSAWHFLTGPADRVAQVIAAWGMWVKPSPSGSLDHPSRIFLVDPQGHQREIYNLEFLKPAAVVRDVKTLLNEEAGAQNTRPRPPSSR